MRLSKVLAVFIRLGCTSFGGPVAHLGYFHREFVERRRLLDDATFGECIALTQLLPGPSSSQTGMLIGWIAAGPLGALTAWIGFTLPSAVLMTAFALALPRLDPYAGWLHGLLLVAAAVVASAIVTMRATLAPDFARILVALGVFGLVILAPFGAVAPVAIALAAIAGAIALHGRIPLAQPHLDLRISRRAGTAILVAFTLVFAGLTVWATHGSHVAILATTLFGVGSLVFGGGHVVLPLLQTQLASGGIIDQRTMLAGYGAAQAMPGPLFTLASFVGARAYGASLAILGAALGTLAIFAPSFFLLAGIAPFYRALAANDRFRAALAGANAGVVGLLAAAFVTPIWNTAVHGGTDVVFVIAAFLAIHVAGVPAWAVVLLGAIASFAIGAA